MADLKPGPNPKCEVCKRSFADGITLIRQNEKGVLGIWRCEEHNSKRDPVLDRAIFDVQTEQSLEVVELPDMDTAIAAGDGTLHGAIDYWQEQHAKATAALAQKDAEIALLVAERDLAWTMYDQLRARLNKETS